MYMVQPLGFINSDYPNHICKLQKSLYGLKQVPRAWYLALTYFLLNNGFRKSQADVSLFVYNYNNIMFYFMVYVDDIALIGNNPSFITKFVDMLAQRFSIKDLGQPSHVLGVEIIPKKFELFLSQHAHICDILT